MARPEQQVPLPAWTAFVARTSGGGVLDGRVTQVLPFGAFVEVAEGIQALLPKSAWSAQPVPRSSIAVRIASIDVENRRLSLDQAQRPWWGRARLPPPRSGQRTTLPGRKCGMATGAGHILRRVWRRTTRAQEETR
jgi:hypothetical protein